jgi:hypothetical protein
MRIQIYIGGLVTPIWPRVAHRSLSRFCFSFFFVFIFFFYIYVCVFIIFKNVNDTRFNMIGANVAPLVIFVKTFGLKLGT